MMKHLTAINTNQKYFDTLYDRYTDAIRDTANYLKYEHELDKLKKGFED